jgi:hypothetical protein
MRHRNDSGVFIYLPTGKTYMSIYEEFKEHFYIEHNESDKVVSYSTFKRIWQETIPNLKFQSHASDLCETCESFKALMQITKNNVEEFENIKIQFKEHKLTAEQERQNYNNIINKAKQNFTITHIYYDWIQHLSMPYTPQQVSSLYFKSPFIVHLFGVCKTDKGQNHQLNFFI